MQVALSFPISHEAKTVRLPLRPVCIHDVNRQEPGVPRHRDLWVADVGARVEKLVKPRAAAADLALRPYVGGRHCNAAPIRVAGVAGDPHSKG
jgi:hypothetical protein